MSRWAWLALVAIGCGHAAPAGQPSPPPPPVVVPDAAVVIDAAPLALDEDLPRLATRAVEMYQAWRKVFDAAGTDCAAAAKGVNEVADTYADVIAANAKVLHAGRERVLALRQALAVHEAELDEAAKAIVQSNTMAACHEDKAFAAAVDRMGGDQ